jgi:hypothetical protein
MKLKKLAIIAISGLFAVTLANAAPTPKAATADETAAMGDASMNDAMNSAPATNSAGISNPPSANPDNGNVGALANNDSNDDMSADTATGDDDY